MAVGCSAVGHRTSSEFLLRVHQPWVHKASVGSVAEVGTSSSSSPPFCVDILSPVSRVSSPCRASSSPFRGSHVYIKQSVNC